jgi:microcystin-dependent protein
MSQPFVGEIRMFGGNFAPAGWAFCNGQLMPISENDVLFNLIGTTYGGDGQETFALPDLRGRLPVHTGTLAGSTRVIGEAAGTETVTLNRNQIPAHRHAPMGSSVASAAGPSGTVPALWSDQQYSTADPTQASLLPSSIGLTGDNQPHENRSPYQAISFIISLLGIYPAPA